MSVNQLAPYVLITAAHNEEAYIEGVLDSVVRQTVQPVKWVIVSDGSVDATDEIVRRYSAKCLFIELLHLNGRGVRSFASKAYALNIAARHIGPAKCAFVGHLDADISFDSTYMSALLDKFRLDPRLGVAGGFIYERQRGEFRSRSMNGRHSVAGAVQMFRRECYEAIGEFLPLPSGGEDWHAEVKARMNGWRVVAFPELRVNHHRPVSAAAGFLSTCYRQGFMDYDIGSHPLFEVVKVMKRFPGNPAVLGPVARLLAFFLAHCRREERLVSSDVVKFLRSEQLGRLFPFKKERHVELDDQPW